MRAAGTSHAALMDGVYRHQRYIYDLTRKYYLLGRDRLIEGLDAQADATVLELGCGTGRNLVLAARTYPRARLFGLDISDSMLETAAATMARKNLSGRVVLARGDASKFDVQALFGCEAVDRVFLSYALSMIPDWRRTIIAALATLSPGGSLHIVDFGRQDDLPGWFRTGLRSWLGKFHVAPRDSMREVLEAECQRIGASLSFESLYRGYAIRAVITLRD